MNEVSKHPHKTKAVEMQRRGLRPEDVMRRRKLLRLVIVGSMTASACSSTQAADLALDITGDFGPNTTLGGTALGMNTSYSFHAVFDPSNEVFHMPGAGIFPVKEFAITIAGHGTFIGIPNSDLNAVVVDPNYHLGFYGAGLVDLTATAFFLQQYSTVSLSFNPASPTPTTFIDYLGTAHGAFPYVIPLAGGANALAIYDFAGTVFTASLVSVPEPSSPSLAILCILAYLSRVGASRRSGIRSALRPPRPTPLGPP